NDMTVELRQADKAKDEFLSVISHELRTPLNFIMGFTSILDDEVAGPMNAQQHEFLGKILGGVDRMLVLVNDLLDFAKIQAGKLTLAPDQTEIRPLVDDVLATMRPLADQKRITLSAQVAEPYVAYVDGRRILQVLTNLVGNAIKFTPEGGKIHIEARREGDRLCTEVTDTGIGIAPEDVPKLFTRFRQLDMSNTREAGGTGLGLSISKGIVEAHGGEIGVRSRKGVGSTFWFTLPLQAPSAS
ncbi:MAG TPA: HAMP domain-containing sensor histidine kinase, partial [Stenomitos sp.]